MLRIIADENIPLAAEAFGRFGEVRCVPATTITRDLVRDADVLLVRSVTRVDEALVRGSRLRFVGSATIGADHIDEDALGRARITFRHAPGSNAESVVEYVLAALLVLGVRTGQPLRGKRVGIIGCGNIGSRLAQRLPAFGAAVLRNDPPLAAAAERAGQPHQFVALEHVLAECDVITCHVPLTSAGPHPTQHLIAECALAQLAPGAWLLNTSRGAVVSNASLAAALRRGAPGAVVLDVWEGEPAPDPELINLASLATAHIAGYSWDGKINGTIMLHRALVAALELDGGLDVDPALADRPPAAAVLDAALAPGPGDRLLLEPPPPSLGEAEWLHALTAQLYDIEQDDARMRTLILLPQSARAAAFRELRRTHPRRRAFQRHVLPDAVLPAEHRIAVQEGLLVSATAQVPIGTGDGRAAGGPVP
jgi:erythronate-4-phosphate dehydrogenase